MTPEEAAAVLRIDPGASHSELRSAYRARLREVHPDRGGSATETEAVLAAYGRLLGRQTVDAGSKDDGPNGEDHVGREQHDAAIEVVGAHEEVFMGLLEALGESGEVTYVDPEAGLLEALIDGVHRLTVTLQGRATHVEVLFTLESPGPEGAPVLTDLARVLTEGFS